MGASRRQSRLPAPTPRKGATPNDITEDADREALDLDKDPQPISKRKRDRETGDLRAMVADAVHEYTTLRRREQIRKGYFPDDAQEVIPEYDPVVHMALIAVRTDLPLDLRLAANAQVAKFLRPQLKSVENHNSMEAEAEAAERKDKASAIFDELHKIARNRRLAHDAQIAQHGIELDKPEPINVTPARK